MGNITAWARPAPVEDRVPLVAVVAVAAAGAAAIVASGVLWHYPLVYIVLPGLVWAAFVGGARAVTPWWDGSTPDRDVALFPRLKHVGVHRYRRVQ